MNARNLRQGWRQVRGNHFSTGDQGQKSAVRHKRGINFLTPSQILGGQLTPMTRTSRAPGRRTGRREQ